MVLLRGHGREDAQTTASVIVTFAQGVWRMAMVYYDRPSLKRQIEAFLVAVGL